MPINLNKYIKRFNTEAEFLAFKSSPDYMEPNISFVNESDGIHFGEPAGVVDPYLSMPLTFEILEDGNLHIYGAPGHNINLAYRVLNDENEDSEWIEISYGDEFNVYAGDKVEFVGDNEYFSDTGAYPITLKLSGEFNVYGNIMSLLDYENYAVKTSFSNDSCYDFCSLFQYCDGLISAEHLKLPATTLATECYSNMFYCCTSLTTAPELPATTLANNCYYSMFYGCTSLTTAPELPATTLANNCYQSMFNGCTSLTTIKAWFTNADASNCLYNWISGGSVVNVYIKEHTYNEYGRSNLYIPSGYNIFDIDTDELIQAGTVA